MSVASPDLDFSERVLVVRTPPWLADTLRTRYPKIDVISADSYLGAIGELSRGPARAVIVGVDPTYAHLDSAVAGLREAMGERAKVLLCCEPAAEPLARRLTKLGGADYLIYPPSGDELDRSLDLAGPVTPRAFAEASATPVAAEELADLAEVLVHVGAGTQIILEQLAKLVQRALRARGSRAVAHGCTAHAGEPAQGPVLAEPIRCGQDPVGQLTVAAKHDGAYSSLDADKLKHYARLAGYILEAADRQSRWRRLALTDDLSGLYNRRYLIQFLGKLLPRAAHERFRVTVVMFDIDNLKRFNDERGHTAGDEIIREAAGLFRKHCRKHDVVSRYGGDEFAVVFWDADQPRVAGSKHPSNALDVLRRFRAALESHQFPSLGPQATGQLTISAGLASFPWDAQSPEELIHKADEALLRAKQAGKNRIYLVGQDHAVAETPPPPQGPAEPGDRLDQET